MSMRNKSGNPKMSIRNKFGIKNVRFSVNLSTTNGALGTNRGTQKWALGTNRGTQFWAFGTKKYNNNKDIILDERSYIIHFCTSHNSWFHHNFNHRGHFPLVDAPNLAHNSKLYILSTSGWTSLWSVWPVHQINAPVPDL